MNFRQFFIFGNPRSGTSLLRLILNSHSLITVAPECGFFLWLHPKYKNWNSNSLKKNVIQEFVSDLQSSRKFETWKLNDFDIQDTIQNYMPLDYLELMNCVYLSYAKKMSKTPLLLGDKNNYYINHLEEIEAISCDNFSIHVVRDGRDVVTSYREIKSIPNTYKYKPKLTESIEQIAYEWNSNNLNIYNFYKNKKNYIIIKYEDLLLNPEQTLRKLLHVLNLKFEKQMLEFYKLNRDYAIEPEETIAWKMKTLQPLDENNIGKYKKKLTLLEIETFNKLAQESLKLFGYVT
jgi:hypothetical protein